MTALRDLRFAKGWTAKEAAQHLSMSAARYAKLESGHTVPSPQDLEAMARAFDVTTDHLKKQFRSSEMNEQILPPAGEVLQIRKIGNSLGLILPKELLAKLDLDEGDLLHVVRQPDRGMHLTPYDPKHAKAMEIARGIFKTYANTFKALAK
jgi:putative addiction module antidote